MTELGKLVQDFVRFLFEQLGPAARLCRSLRSISAGQSTALIGGSRRCRTNSSRSVTDRPTAFPALQGND